MGEEVSMKKTTSTGYTPLPKHDESDNNVVKDAGMIQYHSGSARQVQPTSTLCIHVS